MDLDDWIPRQTQSPAGSFNLNSGVALRRMSSLNLYAEVIAFLTSTHQFPSGIPSRGRDSIFVNVVMDSLVMLDQYPNIMATVLRDYDMGCALVKNAIEEALAEEHCFGKVCVRILFQNLPRNDLAFVISGASGDPLIGRAPVNGVKSVIGVLVARSTASSRICPYSQEQRQSEIVHFVDADNTSVQDELACTLCESVLVEVLRRRQIVECSTCLFMPSQVFEAERVDGLTKGVFGKLYQPISILVEEEWFHQLHFGHVYEIFVMPSLRQQTSHLPKIIKCINIVELRPTSSVLGYLASQIPESTPMIFQNFKELLSHSPWAFVGWLSFCFGDTVTPKGTFLPLKMSLLLSLASLFNDRLDHFPISILVAMGDSLIIHKLMNFAMSITSRKIIHSGQSPLTIQIRKDGTSNLIEAGSLLLAHTGVCFVGDLLSFSNEALYSLKKALESSEVRVETSRKAGTIKQDEANFRHDLSSTVLGYMTIPAIKKKNCLEKLRQLIDVFGLVILPEKTQSIDNDQRMCDLILTQHDSTNLTSKIDVNEWKTFFQLVNERRVIMSDEAEILLKKYFVASRKIRSGTECISVPQGALKTLTNLSKSHAAVSCRSVVSIDDATVACFLYETNMLAFSGFSIFSSEIELPQDDSDDFTEEYARVMKKFQVSLIKFVEENDGVGLFNASVEE